MEGVLWHMAYAEVPDASEPGLRLVVLCVGVAAAGIVLGLIPIGVASSRRSRWIGPVVLASLVWTVLACGHVLYASVRQLNWSREHSLRLQSGYYDATDLADEPAPPQWLMVGIVYAAIVGAALVPVPRREATCE